MRHVDDLLLVGASHRTATVDVRGRLAERATTLGGVPAGVREMLVLSTCHRVEVMAAVHDGGLAERALRSGLTGAAADVAGLYVHSGLAAVLHLSRVAAGLDSLIVGEAEVSGQIRRAVVAGRERGLVGPGLERVMAGVLRAGGRARSETRIGQGTLSAATAAVSLLERAWGSFKDRSVLVIGAGEAGKQVLARLRKRRAGGLAVASRSFHHASEAAARTGARIVDLSAVSSTLAAVHGVIVATRSTSFLIDAAACRATVLSGRSLDLVDLSVPRVVDPAVTSVAGVRLFSVDDLGDVVRESVRRRENEIPSAERVVGDEAARTYQQFADWSGRRRRAVA